MDIPYTGIRLRLHKDWKQISARAWSARLNYGQIIVSGIDASMSYAMEGRVGMTIASFGIGVAIAIARVVHQERVSGAPEPAQ